MGGLVLLFVAAAIGTLAHNSHAISAESKGKMAAEFIPVLQECAAEQNVDLNAFKEHIKSSPKEPDSKDSCLFACIFKKLGFLDEQGMFDNEKAFAKIEEQVTNPEDIETLKKNVGTCVSVNEESVSDGAEGCERSMLLLHCIKKTEGLLVMDKAH